MQLIRIYDMPPCRMVASPVGMFGERALDDFDAWMSAQPRRMFPRDFLTWDESDPAHPGFRWYYMYEEGMALPEGAAVVDFPGGMYAVATGIDQQTDKLFSEGEKYNAAHPELPISFAVGAVLSSEHPGVARNELLHLADEEMYQNKKAWYAQKTTGISE